MKNRQLMLLFGLLVVLVLLTILFLRKPSTRFDWSPSYEAQSKQPYGTHVMEALLRGYFPGKGFEVLNDSVKGNLPSKSAENANYVFIGEALFLDSLDADALLKFVENGNTAFISSRTIPYDLMFYVYYDECNDIYWEDYSTIDDSTVQLNVSNKKLKAPQDFEYSFYYRNKIRPYEWSYIEGYYFCDGEFNLMELGRMNDTLINFAKVKYGEGTFYLHTVPLAFTNFHMLDSTHLQYANRVFSYLPPGKIYWDEYSKTFESVGRRRNNSDYNRQISRESPVQYLLSQPPLAWAWYLLLAMGVLFLLFRTKRRQRTIPVLESNANTSLEFVSTIGRLYFLQNSHRKLALQKMKLFQNFVRERYHLRGHELDAEFIAKLIAKSGVPLALVDRILLMHRNISNSRLVTENTLIEFHQLLDEFYKTCK